MCGLVVGRAFDVAATAVAGIRMCAQLPEFLRILYSGARARGHLVERSGVAAGASFDNGQKHAVFRFKIRWLQVCSSSLYACTNSLMGQRVELGSPDLWVVQMLRVAGGWVGADKIMAVLLAVKLAYPMPRFVLCFLEL